MAEGEFREVPIDETPFGRHDSHLVRALRSVLADRERELLEIKGPCSSAKCRLHYAHSGPCDIETDA